MGISIAVGGSFGVPRRPWRGARGGHGGVRGGYGRGRGRGFGGRQTRWQTRHERNAQR